VPPLPSFNVLTGATRACCAELHYHSADSALHCTEGAGCPSAILCSTLALHPHPPSSTVPSTSRSYLYHDLKLVLDGTLATQLRQWSRLWRNNYATCCGFPATNASTFSLVPPIASTLR
jgi:hypothetical protein